MKNSHITKLLSITAIIAGLAIGSPFAWAQTTTEMTTTMATQNVAVKGDRPTLVTTLSPDAVYMHTAYVSAVVRAADSCGDIDAQYGMRFNRGGVWFSTADYLIPSEDGIISYKAKKMTSGATFTYQAFVIDCTGTTYGNMRKFTTKVAVAAVPVVVETPVVTTPVVDTKAAEKAAKEEAKKAEEAAKQAQKDKKAADKKAAEEAKKAESDAKKKADEAAKTAADAQKAQDAAAKKSVEEAKKAVDAAKKIEVIPAVVPVTPKVKIDTTNGTITPAATTTTTTEAAVEVPVKEKTGFIKWLIKGNSDK